MSTSPAALQRRAVLADTLPAARLRDAVGFAIFIIGGLLKAAVAAALLSAAWALVRWVDADGSGS
jgi:biotin transporter BioY